MKQICRKRDVLPPDSNKDASKPSNMSCSDRGCSFQLCERLFVLNTCRSVFGDACSKTTLQRLMRHLHPSNSAKVPSKVLRDWWGI